MASDLFELETNKIYKQFTNHSYIIQSIKVNQHQILQSLSQCQSSRFYNPHEREKNVFSLLINSQFQIYQNLIYQSYMAKDMQLLYVLKAGGIDHLSAKRYLEASIYFQDVLSNFQQCLGNIDSSTQMQKVFRQVKLSSHKNLSLCYLKLNQFQKCVHQCKIILEIQPNCLKILYRIGRAYICMQKYEQAKEYLIIGFHLDPQEKQIMKALEELQQINFTNAQLNKIKHSSLIKQLFTFCIIIVLFLFDKLISPLRWLRILKPKIHTA